MTAPLSVEHGPLFAAEIVDQQLIETASGQPAVVFTVRLLERVVDRNLATQPCAPQEHDVVLVFPEDEQRFRMAAGHLRRLGFESNDLGLLHPDHPAGVSLVGHPVHVRAKLVDDGRCYWNFAWPQRRLVSLDEAQRSLASVSARIANLAANPASQVARPKGSEAIADQGNGNELLA